jgi:uncharacterized protein YndB with AHSA1/START domain
MATVRRSRPLAAPPDEVWRTVGDLHQLARWWPKVLRVEDVRDGRFTEVLQTDRGRDVRADWVLVETVPGERWRATQELDGTPFEKVLGKAGKAIMLEASGDGTRVTLELERRLRGLSRLGGMFLRRATTLQVDAALDTLSHDSGRGLGAVPVNSDGLRINTTLPSPVSVAPATP